MLTRLVLAVDRHVTGAIWTVAALLLAAVPPTADELYRNCVPVIEEDYHSQLRDLLCMSITTGGYSVAKNRDAQVGVQRFCLPPGVSLERTPRGRSMRWPRHRSTRGSRASTLRFRRS